jgi:hypothetical protein
MDWMDGLDGWICWSAGAGRINKDFRLINKALSSLLSDGHRCGFAV